MALFFAKYFFYWLRYDYIDYTIISAQYTVNKVVENRNAIFDFKILNHS